MLDETVAGLIPRIILQRLLGPKDYALLVTDRRSIFVHEVVSETGIGRVSGGVVGAAVVQAPTSGRKFAFERPDPDVLATDPKNFVIPHEWLERIEMKKSIMGPLYRFNIEYMTKFGRVKKVKGRLVPAEMSRRRKQEGTERMMLYHDYARKFQEVYDRALPATASAAITEWKV